MGKKNKRRRKRGGRRNSEEDDGDVSGAATAAVYQVEDDVARSGASTLEQLPEWSIDYVRNITTTAATLRLKGANLSIQDVGEFVVKGTLELIQSKKNKKKGKNNNYESTSIAAVTPTSIQLRLWPAMLHSFHSQELNETSSKHNICGIAATGTGKTLAYAIPIVAHCIWRQICQKRNSDDTHPRRAVSVHGLVFAPTRELAIQISKEFKIVSKSANKLLSNENSVEAVAIYGGVDAQIQTDIFSQSEVSKLLIVAATPGRLLDLLKNKDDTNCLSAFDNLQSIVFDEADRIAMNPEMTSQVDNILGVLNEQRNQKSIVSCLVSATLPEKAREVCDRWVPRSRFVVKIDSVKIGMEAPSIKGVDTDSTHDGIEDEGKSSKMAEATARKSNSNIDFASIPSHIVQTCHVCSNHKKPRKLILTLSRLYKNANTSESEGSQRFTTNNRLCIVFFAQIKTVKYASKLLQKEELRCVELYGSLHQSEREKRLLDFKAGKIPILLATDVAARGIHFNNVHYVVNYDFPSSIDQYVHRCGRAGRKQLLSGEGASKNPPIVYSFFTREFAAMADALIQLLMSCNADVDPNLLALSSSNKLDNQKSAKNRKRKSVAMSEKDKRAEDNDDSEDEFPFLGKSNVLKRASHVSDAEDSESE